MLYLSLIAISFVIAGITGIAPCWGSLLPAPKNFIGCLTSAGTAVRPEVIKDGVPVGDIVGTYQGFPDEE